MSLTFVANLIDDWITILMVILNGSWSIYRTSKEGDLSRINELKITTTIEILNSCNSEIQKKLLEAGKVWLHNFNIPDLSNMFGLDKEISLRPLRFMSGNPTINVTHLDQMLDLVEECGIDIVFNNIHFGGYSMFKATDELCKKLFEKIKSEIVDIENIEKLPKTRNEVFLITTTTRKFFAKIYMNEAFNYVEELLYNRLKNSPYIKKICFIGMLDHRKYVVTEFCDGKTLLARLNDKLKDSDINYIAVQLHNFIRMCMEVKVSRFGRIQKNGEGSSGTWSKWLSKYLLGLKERTKKLKTEDQGYISPKLELLTNFFESCSLYFCNLEPRLILVDLNLTNFLIRDTNELLILDLESFWHGDPLLAYGDWLGNTYLTPLQKSFSQHWGTLTSQETQIIHAYALLSNVSALIFISEHGNNIFQSSPWGNPLKYVDLIPSHVNIIVDVKKKIPEMPHLSLRNQVLGSQTQPLLNWTILHKRTNHFIKMVREFCNTEFKRENKNFL